MGDISISEVRKIMKVFFVLCFIFGLCLSCNKKKDCGSTALCPTCQDDDLFCGDFDWAGLGRCRDCCADWHCGANHWCQKIGVNRCVSKKNNGEGCSRDSKCKSGHCCSFDYPIPIIYKCKECCSSSHCPSGKPTCNQGTCQEGKIPYGQNCRQTSDCETNLVCCRTCRTPAECNPVTIGITVPIAGKPIDGKPLPIAEKPGKEWF